MRGGLCDHRLKKSGHLARLRKRTPHLGPIPLLKGRGEEIADCPEASQFYQRHHWC
jgi:hypothetical protein